MNWKREMGETAAEIKQKRMDQMMNASLIGSWRGGLSKQANWGREISLDISEKNSESYTGHASLSYSSHFPSCANSEVELKYNTDNLYFITFTGPQCHGQGELEYSDNRLSGRVEFRQGRFTLDVVKAE